MTNWLKRSTKTSNPRCSLSFSRSVSKDPGDKSPLSTARKNWQSPSAVGSRTTPKLFSKTHLATLVSVPQIAATKAPEQTKEDDILGKAKRVTKSSIGRMDNS